MSDHDREPPPTRRRRITLTTVKALEPDGRFVSDGELPGFLCRKSSQTGQVHFYLRYKLPRGPRRTMPLGSLAFMTPDEARRAARSALAKVYGGQDPWRSRRADPNALTIAELCKRYMQAAESGRVRTRAGQPKRPGTIIADRRCCDLHIGPALGHIGVRNLQRSDVVDMIAKVEGGSTAVARKFDRHGASAKGGAGIATRVAAVLSAVYSWAVEQELAAHNPVKGIRRARPRQIGRALDAVQYARLGAEIRAARARGVSASALDAITTLAMTGCRRGEVFGLRWSEIDDGHRCLRLAQTKSGASIRPVGHGALEILNRQPRVHDSPWVFISNSASGHLEKPDAIWADLIRRAELGRLRLHDLRHSFASVGVAELGLSESTVGAVIGHATSTTVTGRYLHIDRALASAAERLCSYVARALGDEQPGTIIELPAAR